VKHLIICREYPPAPSGGIGTYVDHLSRLLAESGETVHVVGQMWTGAEKALEERCAGRLIIHRIPFEDWVVPNSRRCPAMDSPEAIGLYESVFPPQSFSWLAGLLAEQIIEHEGIDIIEAQEYEAPLYYLQLRRSLGLGPKRHPPSIVHLHSPTQFIAHYDDWDVHHLAHTTAKRLENYSMMAADALLCPSRYLARQVESHCKLPDGSIHVIPYPFGDIPMLERDMRTWEQGTISYMGRLERRKGVLEWIDAAVTVAYDYPTASFEFLGANILGTNTMSGADVIQQRIPDDLKKRFHFHGQQPRSLLPKFLAGARAAVVPSRWENFPNTCIEAMGTGLPVIASCEGGMVEMIEDGRTGWIARTAESPSLADALRRALDTPALTLAEMGREAAASIRRLCDNGTIVQRQLEFRQRLIQRGAANAIQAPPALPGPQHAAPGDATDREARTPGGKGFGAVITCFNDGCCLDECLATVEHQDTKFDMVVIVDHGSTDQQTLAALDQAQRDGWCVIHTPQRGPASAKNAGLEWMLQCEGHPIALAFLDAKDRVRPDFVAACEAVFLRDPEVGLVSSWALDLARGKSLWCRPCPSFPYQWLANDIVPFAAVRTEALREVGRFHSEMDPGYDGWDMFDTVMAAGWMAVTVPMVLGEAHFEQPARPYMPDPYQPVSARS
jgi:glycosyltransferase involved in cell wall biosynthesis